MRLYRYWAKASMQDGHKLGMRVGGLSVRRGSDISPEDARERAAEALVALTRETLKSRDGPESYHYGERGTPEPIVREFGGTGGERLAALTVNRMGCVILNTARLAFVDVDLSRAPALSWLKRAWTGGGRSAGRTGEAAALDRLRGWLGSVGGVGARAYRTAAGLRYAIVSPAMDPTEPGTRAMFAELRADPKYALLCERQRSFRARLTPKPWRMRDWNREDVPAMTELPEDGGLPREYLRWRPGYDRARAGHAVCELIEQLGQRDAPDALTAELLALHDAETGASSGKPLA
ncbi:MAG: hypothetical protein C0475_07120 [Planctomyces sp.]|nr:hypothetical protein [Planctomyces sp.]MBA4119266.1 hypothetical protein [Isosphaera sp.]